VATVDNPDITVELVPREKRISPRRRREGTSTPKLNWKGRPARVPVGFATLEDMTGERVSILKAP
tara:strand:+ start:341 stop:535 length:195 start_codon:yes stop_codon:yes gene_type:complete